MAVNSNQIIHVMRVPRTVVKGRLNYHVRRLATRGSQRPVRGAQCPAPGAVGLAHAALITNKASPLLTGLPGMQ